MTRKGDPDHQGVTGTLTLRKKNAHHFVFQGTTPIYEEVYAKKLLK